MKAISLRRFSLLWASLMVVFMSTSLTAATSGLFTYEVVDGTTITITDYPTTATGDVVIPATIEGKSVTSIGAEAFRDCASLTSVTIPNGVTSILHFAFYGCSGLTSVTIPNGVTSIGGVAFGSCTDLTNITIPSGVTSIGDSSFRDCTGLTSITMPSGVPSIGRFTFQDCTSLIATSFLGDVPVIGRPGAFHGVNANHIIYYLDTSTGFTSPTWEGYPTQMINTTTYPAAVWLLESNQPYDTSLNQDLNGDGVSLLMAYALNLNPNERLTNRLPKAELNSDTVSMEYYSGSAGVAYRVESSKDLKAWDTVTSSAPDANGVRTASIPRDEGCGFLRLAVVEE